MPLSTPITTRPTIASRTAAAMVLLLVLPAPVAATHQAATDTAGGPLMATRSLLNTRLEAARLLGEDGANQVEAIQRRLALGDFRQGDRILLSVEGELAMTDTFAVGSGGDLTLPGIGSVSLEGVLRSELQAHLTKEIARYLRDPMVRAQPLVGVTVVGEVARAGFHWVPSDGLVADVLNAAGGGTRNAMLEEMRIERGTRIVIDEPAMQHALASLATLDDAGILPGDRLVVPPRGGATTYQVVRTISIVLTIPLTIFALTQIFK